MRSQEMDSGSEVNMKLWDTCKDHHCRRWVLNFEFVAVRRDALHLGKLQANIMNF